MGGGLARLWEDILSLSLIEGTTCIVLYNNNNNMIV